MVPAFQMRPIVVAEISGNHNGSLERALQIVEAAAVAGAHAVKLQTYTPDTMTLPGHVIHGGPWDGLDLYELYRQAHTPWDWHAPLFDRAKSLGMIAFSTPFDSTAVDFLETLDCPIYKIASFEVTDLPLIRYAAATGKQMVISTGMATREEIASAVLASGKPVLLKCTSAYPAKPAGCNLLTIPCMRARFGRDVGLSDHTLGIGAAVASVALGAVMIEKHLTLSRADGGPDSGFSLEPDEFAGLVREVNTAYEALGEVHYGPTEQERDSLQFRRSVYAVRDIKAGAVITGDDIKCLRPALGVSPHLYGELIGKRAVLNIASGTPMRHGMA